MSRVQEIDPGCIHIGTGFDKNYLNPFYSLMTSLIENHSSGQFEIHAITKGISADEKNEISSVIGKSGNRISFYDVDPSLVKQFILSSQWTSVVYYRLFFTMLISRPIQRLIYLDCDTVVINSLWPLYNINLDNHPVGAVYDNYVKTQPYLGIINEGEYFNSGVLVMDVEKWKQQEISEKAFGYLLEYPENILFVDQCALNAVLRNNWKKLNNRFNLMYSVLPEGVGKKALSEFLKDGVVVHFTLQRPWHMLCKNRLRQLYFYYLKRSGMNTAGGHDYTDFEIKKIPGWLKIRLQEFYFDSPYVQRIWRFINLK
ncbi:MAG: glycosyltransferase family 8 protein [Cyclobacteriaceae bacterium]